MKISLFLNHHHWWIQPIVAAVLALSSKYMGYKDFSTEFIHLHPVQYAFWMHVIDNLTWIWAVSIILLMVVTINDFLSKKSIKTLTEDLRNAEEKNEVIGENLQRVFEGYLYQLSKKLGFGTSDAANDNCERVTLYIHDRNGKFTSFGRYSSNPAFGGPGRPFYPDNEGCISRGWQSGNGWHFENDLGRNQQDYRRNTRSRYSIQETTLNTIRMKSRMYAVKRIVKDNMPLAVLLVESLDSNRYTEDEIKDMMEQEHDFIADLIIKLWDYIPKPTSAKSRGF